MYHERSDTAKPLIDESVLVHAWTCIDTMQIMSGNVAAFGSLVLPIHAAIVDEVTAEEKSCLEIAGKSASFQGYHVVRDDATVSRRQWDGDNPVLHQVKTVSLADLQVYSLYTSACYQSNRAMHLMCSSFCHLCVLQDLEKITVSDSCPRIPVHMDSFCSMNVCLSIME